MVNIITSHRTALSALALFMGTPALAAMEAPLVGDEYAFDCSLQGGFQYQETYRVAANNGGIVRVNVETGKASNWYEKPFYLIPTTLATAEKVGGRESRMRRMPDDFEQLRNLKVGTSVNAWVTEDRGTINDYSWSYKVAVVGNDVYYNRDFGDLDVTILDEQRYTGTYSSKLVTYYAPRLRFPVYWKYTDSNRGEVECQLVTASLNQPQIAGSGQTTPPPATKPAAATFEVAALPPRTLKTLTRSNVRVAPTANADRLTVLPVGTDVRINGEVASSAGKWYRITLSTGDVGYIFGSLVGEAAPAPKPTRAATETSKPTAGTSTNSTSTRTAAVGAVAPAPRASAPAVSKSERLARIEDLYKSGLLTAQEYEAKKSELAAERAVGGIAAELTEVNRKFRRNQLTPEAFVKARADVLARINPDDMDPKQGLVLLNQLLEQKLISQTEYGRKRQLMIDSI